MSVVSSCEVNSPFVTLSSGFSFLGINNNVICKTGIDEVHTYSVDIFLMVFKYIDHFSLRKDNKESSLG